MKSKLLKKVLLITAAIFGFALVSVVNYSSPAYAEPANIQIAAVNDTSMKITWEETSNKPVTNYNVELSIDGTNWFPSPYPTDEQPELNFPRPIVTNDTNFYIRITSEYTDSTSSSTISSSLTIPGLQFSNSTQFTANNVNTIMSDSQRKSLGLNTWVDGNIGFFERNGQIITLAPNSGSTARMVGDLSNPFGTVSNNDIEIQNQSINSDYAAGGPVYYDEANDRLLMFYHGEMHQPSATVFYSYIGMAQSYDGGETFEDLGEIVQSATPLSDPNRTTVEMTGAPYVVKDGYFYVYFKDKRPDGTVVNMAVARASVSDVLSTADLGTTANWQKYSGGSFSVSAIGNEPDDLLAVAPYAIWFDVAYIESLNRYVMVYPSEVSSGQWATLITTSTDGIAWDKPEFLFNGETVDDEVSFTSISSLDFSDQRNIKGNQFYVFRTVSASFDPANPSTRWIDASIERYLVSFSLPSTDPNPEDSGSGSVAENRGAISTLAKTGANQTLLLGLSFGIALGCLRFVCRKLSLNSRT